MNKIFYTCAIAVSLAFAGCEDKIDPLQEELELTRVLTPTELKSVLRNLTTIELTWNTREDADHYVVEFSEDSLEFKSIIYSAEVRPNQLPYQHAFAGETRYSARVKGVSAVGVEDSKWITTTLMTAQENIYLPVQNGDIAATQATLRWVPNSEVTGFLITPGNVTRAITAEEKVAGVAIVSGLTGETAYTVVLKNGTKNRGSAKFTTLIDIGDATAVHPEDNLVTIINAATSGATLVLFPGEYTVNTGALITLNKAISIKGLYPYDKPKLHVKFSIESGAGNIEMRDLDLDGDALLDDVFRYNTASVTYGTLSIIACNVHDFTRSLAGGNVSAAKVTSVIIDNCIMTDMISTGGDFLDFRNTYVGSITVTNSSFDNCSAARDFVRIDAATGLSGTGLTSVVSIDHCTFYGVSNNMTSTRRLLYVRFLANTSSVKNSLIVQSTGFFANQTATTQPVFLNNNYFNAQRFYDATLEVIANLKVDNSGTHKIVDPGFTDAANGNFKVSNQTIKDNSIGDPRWLQ